MSIEEIMDMLRDHIIGRDIPEDDAWEMALDSITTLQERVSLWKSTHVECDRCGWVEPAFDTTADGYDAEYCGECGDFVRRV